jgi:exportin-2 (importin alpha re-exporter)
MVLEATLDLFLLVQDLNTEEDAGIDQLDPEESTFQASFNKLGASEPAARDPVAGIPDAKLYLSQQLSATSNRHPGKVSQRPLYRLRKCESYLHLLRPYSWQN